MKKTIKTARGEVPGRYGELVAFYPPRPIHDRISYDNTVEMIDALAGRKLTEDQDDYLDLLSQLVERYEAEHLPPYPQLDGVAALKFLLEENGLSGDDLAALLAIDRSTSYKILKGTRRLTADHVRRLAKRFKVGTDLFLVSRGAAVQ
jgi:HTH-type transcriptional regulator/antitoxin HigA